MSEHDGVLAHSRLLRSKVLNYVKRYNKVPGYPTPAELTDFYDQAFMVHRCLRCSLGGSERDDWSTFSHFNQSKQTQLCLGQVTHSFGGIMASRFCIGIPEAAFYPGVMYLLSRWYTKKVL